MTRSAPHKTPDGQPTVRQPPVNGWDISYNPDDRRWYVARPRQGFPGELEFISDFAERRNAVAFAKKKTP